MNGSIKHLTLNGGRLFAPCQRLLLVLLKVQCVEFSVCHEILVASGNGCNHLHNCALCGVGANRNVKCAFTIVANRATYRAAGCS